MYRRVIWLQTTDLRLLGAIGIARACQNIVYNDNEFDFVGSVAAAIVCATLNLYFVCFPAQAISHILLTNIDSAVYDLLRLDP